MTDPRAKEVALQLFDVAALQGGYNIDNPGHFAKRVIEMMKREADLALSEQNKQDAIATSAPPPSAPQEQPAAGSKEQTVQAS